MSLRFEHPFPSLIDAYLEIFFVGACQLGPRFNSSSHDYDFAQAQSSNLTCSGYLIYSQTS
jgi:hypothetical protein